MIIVITGPTATGKTKLSIEIAKQLNGEIINADSTQVYKKADIATAKITKKEKEGIRHHLFSFVNMKNNYTVFDYQKDCRKCIEKIKKRGKTPILVGGTGLYIKAALYNYKFTENKKTFDDTNLSNDELYNILIEKDKNTQVHKNNRKGLINSLTYIMNTGEPYSKKDKSEKLLYNTKFIGLTTDRKLLYEKINTRVDIMVEQGLIKEAKNFYKKIYQKDNDNIAMKTIIGYKELIPYFKDKETLDNCLDTIRQKSRNYAKKQMTWFNNQMKISWFQTNYENFSTTTEEVINFIKV